MPARDGTPTEWPHPFGYALLPKLPPEAPRRGTRKGRWLGRVVLRALGWRVVGPYPDVPKLVVVGAPHTSNWDGVVGLGTILALGLDMHVMIKHTAFRPPLGGLLRRLGGIPVDRKAAVGVVGQMVEEFRRRERFVLGVAPEGTRKKVEAWRTGFYRIAENAGVPIMLVALDHGRQEVRLGPTTYPTGDVEADLREMKAFFATARGKRR